MIYIFVMKKISLTEDEYNTPKYTIKIDGEEKTKLGFMEAILSNFKEEKEWHDNDIEILLHIKSLAQLSDEEMMEIITEPLIDEKDETEIINGSKEVISWKNIKIPMAENMSDKVLIRIYEAIKEKAPSVLG
ncbi:hypothetical protein C5O10_07870 [Akkermansia muciniphila]|uniref:hypothetical protein n=2 Tax=Akkermansiaceae TaxID=1647988 RepID=UPI000C9C8DED|nr:hypothetical protein [Akkermansia muciniphila]QHV14256.1 hypothetical protein C5O09_07825 [Akkermansia muciniphila]QHV16727.1 hypothetical protein C5O10_07870 [Akkermansia muciniphila]